MEENYNENFLEICLNHQIWEMNTINQKNEK